MRVLRLLLAAIAIFGLIDVGSAQYARPTFDDDDDFGYVPPAVTVSQKPTLQTIQPQDTDLRGPEEPINVRVEQVPPRRVTIRRRKKPTPQPESPVLPAPPRGDSSPVLTIPINARPQTLPNPALVSEPLSSGVNPPNAQNVVSGPVTQPPGNFMFMRIGGYGFDNGEVPTGIEPPKQMLPELVPAGVRVRTPSGVVVSVRGQPGLYGIHPTPPPDVNHGPRKPAPKPEIVYLTQTRPVAAEPPRTPPTVPTAARDSASIPYTPDLRTERPSRVVSVPAPQPVRPVVQPVRYQQRLAPTLPSQPQNQGERFVVGPEPGRTILRQSVPVSPPVSVNTAYPRRQPVRVQQVVQERPLLPVPDAGQFGQRLRPLTRENVAPNREVEPFSPGIRISVPPRSSPGDFVRPTGNLNFTPGNVLQREPGLVGSVVPNAVPGSIRIVEPQSVIRESVPRSQVPIPRVRVSVPPRTDGQVSIVNAPREPIDLKKPNLVEVAARNVSQPVTGFERTVIGPISPISVPLEPVVRIQAPIEPPRVIPEQRVILLEQRPIAERPILYETQAPQAPGSVFQQSDFAPGVGVPRVIITNPPSEQQNIIPGRRRIYVRPPSAIPPRPVVSFEPVIEQIPAVVPEQRVTIVQRPALIEKPIQYGTQVPQSPGIVFQNPVVASEIPPLAPRRPENDQDTIIPPRITVRLPSPILPGTLGRDANIRTRPKNPPQASISEAPRNVHTPSIPATANVQQGPVAPIVQKTVVVPSPLDGKQETRPENPNGFSFMRIGGFGFDNGVVPERFKIEPAKEMLPELVPAGVRVRTPSGVVVSVRGRPGLYGIHPTPAPDTSYGPTKRPPRPEIVYLHQTTPRPKPAPIANPVLSAGPVPVASPVPIANQVPIAGPLPVASPVPVVQVISLQPAPPLNTVRQPQRVIIQPQSIPETPLRVFTQVPQTLQEQGYRQPTPVQTISQPPRIVTSIPQRDFGNGPRTAVLSDRSPVAQGAPLGLPRVEIKRINAPSPQLAPSRTPVRTSTGSGGYGNDLSDFEDFEPPTEQKQQLATVSKETRVSSGAISGKPKVSEVTETRSEDSDKVNSFSGNAGGPVDVVIGNINEGPYNFHHRHTHNNGFAFVKLGVPNYQKMEADAVVAVRPAEQSQQATGGDNIELFEKKSRRKSS